jgi:uncharacterized repeat protein (TIGR01451 family)
MQIVGKLMANKALTIFPYRLDMVWKNALQRASRTVQVSMRLLFLLASMIIAPSVMAQSVNTYTNSTLGAIDGNTTCAAPLVRNFTVAQNFIVADVDLGVFATHTWRGDIRITLQAPNGTRVQLVNGDANSTSGDHFNVRLDDAAAQLVNTDSPTGNHSTTAPPPFANTFRPNSPLSAFNGINANGTWRMEICDIFPSADNGQFRFAQLYLTAVPSNFADLSLSKQLVGSAPISGGTATWRLIVSSAGASTATASNIAVRDTLPAGFNFTSASGDGSFNPATGIWTVGSLAPGQNAVMTISGTVTAAAGTTLTNIAEIISSSMPDPNSTPDNGVPGEDDYAVSQIVVRSGRAAGIPPVLPCPTGFSIFNWDQISGWSPGSLDNTYAFASFGNIRFQLTNNGVWLNNALFGGQSPTVVNAFTGGLNPAQNSLTMVADQANQAGVAQLTITLPRTFTGLQFSIFDLDFGPNQFADRVEVVGFNGATAVNPILTNGAANYVSGNELIGDIASDNDQSLGNAVVTFTQPVDRVVLRYGNHTTAPSNPGQQGISVHDIMVCNPFTTLSVTKVSSVISDPVNSTNQPKAIPGALIEYLISVANTGASATDNNSVVVLDSGPAEAKFCQVGRVGGPVVFSDPAGNSGLTYSFINLASLADSLDFSNDFGATWNYVPVADADGCDTAITDFRVRPNGAFAAGRSFSLRVRYIIE